jgi:site-specific DNA recombinase
MNGKRPSIHAPRLALYARVSSDRQAQEGTIDSQVSAIRARIDADGQVLEPEMVFCDDGVSGTTLVRPALERLRDQAAAGTIDQLYVLAPDRLARRHAHQMVLLEELQACGVEVVFVNRPVGATPEDQLLLQVQGVVAEYERAKILERTRRGRLHAARCGRVNVLGKAAYGYRYINKHAGGGGEASYEVLEEEARVVRQIFDWIGRERYSLAEVVRRLERLGVPTRTGRKRWDRSTIWGLLTNPAYKGQAAYGKTRRGERRERLRPMRNKPEVSKQNYSSYRQPAAEQIEIAVPALVDASLFAAVQDQLEENRQRLRQHQRGARFLLQGLLVCGGCGYAIVGKGKEARGRRAYYCCLGTEGHRCGGERVCRNRMQRVEDMDAAVWADVCALLNEPDRLRQEFEQRQQRPAVAAGTAEEERLRKELARAHQGQSRLLDAYTEGLMDKVDFQPRMERLQERSKRLEEELQALTERARRDDDLRRVWSRVQEFAEQVKAGLTTANWAEKREIVRTMVKEVKVDKETLDIVYKVPSIPFVKAPYRGPLQHCWSRVCVGMETL